MLGAESGRPVSSGGGKRVTGRRGKRWLTPGFIVAGLTRGVQRRRLERHHIHGSPLTMGNRGGQGAQRDMWDDPACGSKGILLVFPLG